MPKAQNLLKTEQLTISTTPPVIAFLGRLVSTGLYGKNHAEAAERLLSRSIEGLIIEDFFAKLDPASQTALPPDKSA